MLFFTSIYGTRKSDLEHIVLKRSRWLDGEYQTTFRVLYHHSRISGKTYVLLGETKILYKDALNTFEFLPPEFVSLSEDFVSVVQSIDFMEKLNKLGIADEVLKGINDISKKPELAMVRGANRGVSTSLTRYSIPNTLWQNSIRSNINRRNAFSYSIKLKGNENAHKLIFNFSDNDILGNRLHAIIGYNGVGKTRYLSAIADALNGNLDLGKFEPSRPLFRGVIAVSLSIFDDFYKPLDGNDKGYTYVGFVKIKSVKRTNGAGKENYVEVIKRASDIVADLYNALQEINSRERITDARSIISSFLPIEFCDAILITGISKKEISSLYRQLSSGQIVILYILISIVSRIEEESIILIDEIENHLHPTAVSSLLRIINDLLVKFRAFAIINTHSPIVLQEIPSLSVSIIENMDGYVSVRKPDIQTFGEILDVINDEVYKFPIENSNYKILLRNASKKHNSKAIKDYFEPRLPHHALRIIEEND